MLRSLLSIVALGAAMTAVAAPAAAHCPETAARACAPPPPFCPHAGAGAAAGAPVVAGHRLKRGRTNF